MILDRETIEVPRFAWPLGVYAAVTLVSTAFSPDPRTSLMADKQMVLFLLVPLVYRFAAGPRAATMVTVIVSFAAVSAAVGIVQYGILHYDNLGQRPQGTLGHYMTYSGLLMLVIGTALARVLFGAARSPVVGARPSGAGRRDPADVFAQRRGRRHAPPSRCCCC